MASGGQVVVGRVRGPRGLQGEFYIEVISDSPGRFSSGAILFLDGQAHRIKRFSGPPGGKAALKLEGINSRTDAEEIRGQFLMVTEDMVPPLTDGDFYHFQIINAKVYTQEGEYLGIVTQILSTGSNDVYIVTLDGKELLIPALYDVIKEVDVSGARITVDLPQGL